MGEQSMSTLFLLEKFWSICRMEQGTKNKERKSKSEYEIRNRNRKTGNAKRDEAGSRGRGDGGYFEARSIKTKGIGVLP